MKKWCYKSCLFLTVVYLAALLLSMLYSAFFGRYKPDASKKNWLLTREGGEHDYAVLGSSRVFHMIDVLLLNQLTGKQGMNIGTSGSSYADNYALLLKYLEKNTFSTLVLNADELCFHSSTGYTYPFKDYEYMPYFFEERINKVYADNVPTWKYWLWTSAPLSRYVEFNEHYTWSGLVWQNMRKPFCLYDTTAGTELLYDMKYKKFTAEDTAATAPEPLVIEQNDEKYFFEILRLCRSKGIRVIVVTTPIYLKGKFAADNRQAFMHYLEKLVKRERLIYINFYELSELQRLYYFRDLTHTNIQGSRLYTRYLAGQLKPLL